MKKLISFVLVLVMMMVAVSAMAAETVTYDSSVVNYGAHPAFGDAGGQRATEYNAIFVPGQGIKTETVWFKNNLQEKPLKGVSPSVDLEWGFDWCCHSCVAQACYCDGDCGYYTKWKKVGPEFKVTIFSIVTWHQLWANDYITCPGAKPTDFAKTGRCGCYHTPAQQILDLLPIDLLVGVNPNK